MFSLEGKVCMITGAASGIGRACLQEFLKNGVKAVAIVDIDDEAALKALDEIAQEFGENRAIYARADVCDEKQFEEAFLKTIAAFKNVDVLVNSASIFNDREWKTMFEVNLNGFAHGNFLAFEKYIPQYKSGSEGAIINVCSVSSVNIRGFHPMYTAVKHAVFGLSRTLGFRDHYERTKVKVISVCPGATDTDMLISLGKNCLNEHYTTVWERQSRSFVKQSTNHVAKSIVEIIKKGKEGSAWVIEDDEPSYEVKIPSIHEMRVQ